MPHRSCAATYGGAVQTLPALRLTAALNALAGEPVTSGEMWVPSVVGPELVHHVADPDDLLGLGGSGSTALADALTALVAVEPELWMLCLPVPGFLAGLRGPAELNAAAGHYATLARALLGNA